MLVAESRSESVFISWSLGKERGLGNKSNQMWVKLVGDKALHYLSLCLVGPPKQSASFLEGKGV